MGRRLGVMRCTIWDRWPFVWLAPIDGGWCEAGAAGAGPRSKPTRPVRRSLGPDRGLGGLGNRHPGARALQTVDRLLDRSSLSSASYRHPSR